MKTVRHWPTTQRLGGPETDPESRGEREIDRRNVGERVLKAAGTSKTWFWLPTKEKRGEEANEKGSGIVKSGPARAKRTRNGKGLAGRGQVHRGKLHAYRGSGNRGKVTGGLRKIPPNTVIGPGTQGGVRPRHKGVEKSKTRIKFKFWGSRPKP